MNDVEFDTLRDDLRELQVRFREEETRRKAEIEYPKLKKLIGTFWKSRNCFSCPESPEDYWFVHRWVKDVDTECIVYTVEFQVVDKLGQLRIETDKRHSFFELSNSGWMASSRKEWLSAVKAAGEKWAIVTRVK